MKKYIFICLAVLFHFTATGQDIEEPWHYQVEHEHILDLNSIPKFSHYWICEERHGGKLLPISQPGSDNKISFIGNILPAFVFMTNDANKKESYNKEQLYYLDTKEFTLINIAATKRPSYTEITWNATLKNASDIKFEILSSTNGINFNIIGEVDGMYGTMTKYTYTVNSTNLINHFKLRILSKSGKYSHLSKDLTLVNPEMVNLYPTVSSDYINVYTPGIEKEVRYQILNPEGKLMTEGILIPGNTKLQIESYPNGIYYFTALQGKIRVFNGIFTKIN